MAHRPMQSPCSVGTSRAAAFPLVSGVVLWASLSTAIRELACLYRRSGITVVSKLRTALEIAVLEIMLFSTTNDVTNHPAPRIAGSGRPCPTRGRVAGRTAGLR
jgi:hypothetical protein